jgi:uncharacterized membrane protein
MKTPSTFLPLLLATLLAGGAMAQSGKMAPMTGLSLHKPVRSESRILASHHTPTSSVTNFGTMDFPGASDSSAYRQNDHHQVVGGYGPDLENDIGDKGYLLDLNHHAFKSITYPGAIRTQTTGINNRGEIVGTYIDPQTNYHAFKLFKGKYTNIDFPGAYISQASGINDSGEIVGLYYDSQLNSYGFSLKGTTYNSFQFPNAVNTFALGVNNLGVIVGTYVDTAGIYHGFTLVGTEFTTVDYPGAVFSELAGINNKGAMVGMWGDGNIKNFEGFQHGYAVVDGDDITFDVPFAGVGSTWAVGINRANQIVGLYIDTNNRFFGYSAKLVP